MCHFGDYKIIDCHVHARYLKDRASIVFPEIDIPEIRCEIGHIVRLQDVKKDTFRYVCSTCGKIVYSGRNPYLKYNKLLLASKKNNQLVFPFVAVSPQIKREILFYKQKFGSQGFKLHPNYSSYELDHCEVPPGTFFVIHSGKNEFDNPNRIMNFARQCQGFIIIAHMGRMNKELFDSIRTADNIVLDCSPVTRLWNALINKTGQIYNASFLGKMDTPEEMLQRVMDYIGCKKMVYGSDTPIDSASDDLAVIEKLPVFYKERILYKNILSFFSTNHFCL